MVLDKYEKFADRGSKIAGAVAMALDGRPGSALSLLKRMSTAGDGHPFQMLVEGLVVRRSLVVARQFALHSVRYGSKEDAELALRSLLEYFASNKTETGMGLEFVRDLEPLHIVGRQSIQPQVLRVLCNGNDIDGARKVFDDLDGASGPGVYVTMMNAYARRGDSVNCTTVMELARTRGVRATIPMWIALLNAYTAKSDLKGASLTLQQMRNRGYEPTTGCYAIFLEVFAKRADEGGFMHMLNALRRDGFELDERIYHSWMKLYVQKRSPAQLKQVLSTMINRGVEPGALTYEYVMLSLVKLARGRTAINVWNIARERKTAVTELQCYAQIRALVLEKEFAPIREVKELMGKEKIVPTARIYTALIRAASARGEPDEAWRVYMKMERKGIKPTLRALNELLIATIRRPQKTKRVLDLIREQGFELDHKSWQTLTRIRGAQRDRDGVLLAFQNIEKPSKRDYIFVIEALLECGDAKLAHTYFELAGDLVRNDEAMQKLLEGGPAGETLPEKRRAARERNLKQIEKARAASRAPPPHPRTERARADHPRRPTRPTN
mmetsp:Transcript_1701/g.5129  ORF Transcript_1701/g.5129 Transcript_1701/m.5129 type:complete len:554 (+) Transcript_1701:101-1762(+)